MSRISKETVDQIIQQADIVEVVSDFVTLKKKGQNLWAPCPFHNEKSPSFSVSPAKGIYKCFGCGKAGNSVQFIMDVEGTSFVEALRYLAKKYSIEIPEEEQSAEKSQASHNRDSQYIVSDFAKNFYQDILLNTDEGKSIGQGYLKERGLTAATIKTFELGYSTDSWSGLTDKALAAGYDLKFLEATGLTIVKEDKKYDRFRSRVIFPIHNLSGRTIGFGARTLKSNDKTPKYLNSPESEIYHKSDVLYGMHQAKQAIRMQDNCYLVEGYLDVLSLYQGGIQNVVASSGTSLTENQIKLIGRYTQNITVLYDGDAAGIKASLRGIDLILEGGLNVNVVLFPTGEDPDSYIRKSGDTAFKQYLADHTQDFISFKTELFAKEAENNPVKKAEAIREIVNSIAKVPDAIKRSVFLQRCSRLFEIDEQILISEYNKIHLGERHAAKGQEQQHHPEYDMPETEPEEVVSDDFLISAREKANLRIILLYSQNLLDENIPASQYILGQLEDVEFRTPIYARMVKIAREKLAKGELPLADDFTRHPEKDIREEAINLLTEKFELSDNWATHHIFVPRETDLLQYGAEREVLRLKLLNVRLMIKDNMEALKDLKEPQEITKQLEILKTLKTFDVEISLLLGMVVNPYMH